MKAVCLFNYTEMADFHGYRIESFDPLAYFTRSSHWPLFDLVRGGHIAFDHRRAITAGAAGLDRLYRERNPNYMRMMGDFVDRFRDFDLIVMSTYNFIHPEVLNRELKKPIKILGFIDDPHSTYLRGIPYLWAFDGAFYISPSYNEGSLFCEALEKWGCANHTWWPLVPFAFDRPDMSESFFAQRDLDLVYIGNPSTKVDRFIQLKKHFGNRFRVHGRWPFKGYVGFIRGLLGKPVYPYRVTSVGSAERTRLYWRAKIGFNMHVSGIPMETGNIRMYEVPAHGTMQLCDKAACNAHEHIFAPDIEAVYYDSVEDAIEKAEYYLTHDAERLAIARAGCERFWADYEWEANLLKFLDWAINVPKYSGAVRGQHVMANDGNI